MNPQDKFSVFVKHFVQPTKLQMDYFLSFMEVQQVRKNEILIRSGEVCKKAWYINSGILRHYLVKNRKEGTVWFSFEKDLITEIGSLVTQMPAAHNIVAVTDCELLTINAVDLQHLYDKEKIWERFGRLTSVQYLLLQMERVNDLLFKAGKEKYEDFINKHPDAHQHISLHQIADYIGVKSETLSRIRNRRI